MITAAIVVAVIGGLVSLGSSEYTTARMYQKHYQEYDHYQDPIPVTEPETEHYYHQTHPHRYRIPPSSEKGLDLTSLGILAIIKLLLIKIKGMGLGLLLLFKLPVIFFTFLGKFLLFFKVAKVLKLLALPLLLVGLLPLLLVPLLLLAPLLLPLLLALPIPVLQPAAAAAGRRRRDTRRLLLLQNLLESEQCLERVACVLATDKHPVYTSSIAWGLDRLKSHIAHPKMPSYAEAYREAAEKKLSRGDCVSKYPCKQQQHQQKQPLPKGNRTKRVL